MIPDPVSPVKPIAKEFLLHKLSTTITTVNENTPARYASAAQG
jgi:hypothetical protein